MGRGNINSSGPGAVWAEPDCPRTLTRLQGPELNCSMQEENSQRGSGKWTTASQVPQGNKTKQSEPSKSQVFASSTMSKVLLSKLKVKMGSLEWL